MGVHELWKVLEPTARPVLLESLRGKTLAIDASIWIYHFLKAMRDSSGNAMKAGHLIGFFRRICKLLFYEIRPVFVFDGAAPLIKKITTERRKHRAVKRAASAKSTANKLLTLQLQRLNGEAVKESSKSAKKSLVTGSVPSNVTYHDQGPSSSTPSSSSSFMPQDQFDLPQLEKIAPIRLNDQRLLTEEELEEYAREFTSQARSTGFIESDNVDFQSNEFKAMPIESQYQLLNEARLKSRLRMGYTSSQLGQMFPNSMEFSKFQIDRVSQRNFFTQKLMNLVGMEDDLTTRRVSSEKGKEYMLKRNNNGWTLSLGSHGPPTEVKQEVDDENNGELQEEESDDQFEDVDLDPLPHSAPDHPPQLALERALEIHEEKDAIPTKDTSKRSRQDDQDEAPLEGTPLPPWFYSLEDQPAAKVQKTEGDAVVSSETPAKKRVMLPSTFFLGKSSFLTKQNGLESGEAKQTDAEEATTKATEAKEPVDAPTPEPFLINDIPTGDLSENNDQSTEKIVALPGVPQPAVEIKVPAQAAKLPAEEDLEINDHQASSKDKHDIDTPQEPGISLSQDEIVDLTTGTKGEDQNLPQPGTIHVDLISSPVHVDSELVSSGAMEDKLEAPLEGDEKALADKEAQYDEEQDEDIQNIMVEELEEDERFLRDLTKGGQAPNHSAEIDRLKNLYKKEQRDADTVTGDMVSECMELLQIFGIPYVTAPGEAEAQCATLFELDLVDGVVTDDGDCFLFGDVKVYRHLFNQAKYVEAYDSSVISKDLGLNRDKLISLAYLLGSDYTDGIAGVGPVTGVELLADFDDLVQFKDWWNYAQRHPDDSDATTSTFKKRFLKKFASKLFLSENFPDQVVADAYKHPNVDSDDTQFEWGRPDVEGICQFMQMMAGWEHESVKKLITPVVEDQKRRDLLHKHNNKQTTLDEFAQINKQFKSKRASLATRKLAKS